MKHTKRGHSKWRHQRRNEARRLRCMSDIRRVENRWFNMETDADAYWAAKKAAFLGARVLARQAAGQWNYE